jgi:glycosyltransferase involved in cell wall biosynthesis
MAAAKPIVATTVSGTNQVMHPGQTGLLVPPADSPALAAAILQLLTQPALAQTMGQAARTQVINHYSAQHQTAEHIALYHRLLDAGQ